MSLTCCHQEPTVRHPDDIQTYEYGQQRWNVTDRGKEKNSEKTLSQCQYVHHISHIDWPGGEPGPPRWKAGD